MPLDFSVFGGFVGVCLVVVLSPGSSSILEIRASLGGGPRSGFAAWAGNNLGNAVYATLVVSGVGVLLAKSTAAMLTIQVLGGLYLLYLSFVCARSVRAAWRARSGRLEAVEVFTALDAGPREAFRRGFLTNMTNAKVLIFFLSLLPQFIGASTRPVAQMAVLAGTFLAMTMTWEAFVVLMAVRIRRLIGHPMFPVVFESLCTLVFLGLAAFVFSEASHTLHS